MEGLILFPDKIELLGEVPVGEGPVSFRDVRLHHARA
jgi:hypothetical protein